MIYGEPETWRFLAAVERLKRSRRRQLQRVRQAMHRLRDALRKLRDC